MPRKYVKVADRKKKAAEESTQQAGGAALPAPAPLPLSTAPRGIMPRPDELAQMREIIGVLDEAGVLDERLRGQAPKALALALKGWEMGLPVLQALEGLYIADDGKIAMQADLMRAMVQKSGVGVVIPVENTPTGAVVEAVRYGVAGRPDRTARFSFTLEDAERAGLAHTTSWRRWPGMLCLARATSYACRTVFPDVLAGVSYTPEELQPTTNYHRTEPLPQALRAPAPTPEPVPQEGGGAEGDVTPETQATEAPVSASSPAPPASPEPEPEPESPEPEPTPTATRPLVHSFHAQGPGGEPRVVRTAGITRDHYVAINALTTLKGGNPRWRELQSVGRSFLQQRQLTDLMYLTGAEADELVTLLQQWDAQTPNNPESPARTGKKTPSELLTEVLQDLDLLPYQEQVLTLIRQTFHVGSLDQLGRLQAEQAIAEVRDLARDRDAFILMLERALQEGSV